MSQLCFEVDKIEIEVFLRDLFANENSITKNRLSAEELWNTNLNEFSLDLSNLEFQVKKAFCYIKSEI